MMQLFEWSLVVILAVVGIAISYTIGKKLVSMWLIRQSVSPAQIRNKKNEKEFVNELLEDIRVNTDEWFLMDGVMMQGSVIANDKKNIGILYGDKRGSITILLNLQSLLKFDKKNEDTVQISMQGEHVKDFLTSAEDIIDRRGQELAFFRGELGKRL